MKLQTKILNFLKQQPNTWVIKVEVANERGCPDILACVAGQFMAIEVKAGKDKLSEIQKGQIQLIILSGGTVMVAKNFDTFKKDFMSKI